MEVVMVITIILLTLTVAILTYALTLLEKKVKDCVDLNQIRFNDMSSRIQKIKERMHRFSEIENDYKKFPILQAEIRQVWGVVFSDYNQSNIRDDVNFISSGLKKLSRELGYELRYDPEPDKTILIKIKKVG